MRIHCGILATAFLLVAADAPKADLVKDELAKLQGTWRLAAMEANGQNAPDQQVKNVVRTITGDKYEVTRDNKPAGKGSMSLDPGKSPKAIDAESTIPAKDGSTRTVKILGIYKLEGDSFTTCFADPGKDRPTEFSAKAGSGHRLFVWKREKK